MAVGPCPTAENKQAFLSPLFRPVSPLTPSARFSHLPHRQGGTSGRDKLAAVGPSATVEHGPKAAAGAGMDVAGGDDDEVSGPQDAHEKGTAPPLLLTALPSAIPNPSPPRTSTGATPPL